MRLNVETNKVEWLEQVDITRTSFFLYFNTFNR